MDETAKQQRPQMSDPLLGTVDAGDEQALRLLQDQMRKQSILLKTMRALTSTLVLEDVLTLAARTAGEVMNVASADIYVYSPAENSMTEVAYWGLEVTPEEEAYAGTTISLEERPDYYPFVDDPVLMESQLDDPHLSEQERKIAARWGEKSSLVVPLLYQKNLIGLLGCTETRWFRRFTPEDKDLFRLLAVPAALAIHNAQTFQREEARNRRLVSLLGGAQSVAAALDSEEIRRRVCTEAPGLFPARTCAVSLTFLHTTETAVAAQQRTDGAPSCSRQPDELVADALSTGKPTRTDAGTRPPRIVVPLLSHLAPVGYLDLTDNGREPYSDDEAEVLQILVTQAETALENSRLYSEIERQAISDGLTGLSNQRYFHHRLRQEVGRARRQGGSFSLLMLDIDGFKLVNDRLGHPAGDTVLRAFAELLQGQLREDVDLAARYGGDEFAVILPDVGEEPAADGCGGTTATIVAERICRSLERAEMQAGGQTLALTLSAGVACFPGDADNADALVHAADKALYLAKRLGKNRVKAFH